MGQYRQSDQVRRGTNAPHDHISIGIGPTPYRHSHQRRFNRPDKSRLAVSIASVIVVFAFVLLLTVFAYYFIFLDDLKEINISNYHDELKSDVDFLTNVTRMSTLRVGYGKDRASHGRDSRYWDTDDRRRDADYSEDALENTSMGQSTDAVKRKNHNKENSLDDPFKGGLERKGVGLYNEAGHNELKRYEAEYEASLKNVGQIPKENGNKIQLSDDEVHRMQHDLVDADDDYDDGFGSHDYDDSLSGHGKGDQSNVEKSHDENNVESSDFFNAKRKERSIAEDAKEGSTDIFGKDSSLYSQNSVNSLESSSHVTDIGAQSVVSSGLSSKRKPKTRKFSGSCDMKFLNSTAQLIEPLASRKFARFFLQYKEMEEKPEGEEQWKPRFAGHQNLQEREKSFLAHDQKINCGFVKGPKGSPSPGFDLAEDDANYISRCHIAVISAIFGNSDRLRTPTGKTVTRLSRKNVCFVMFMDETTLQTLVSEGQTLDRTGFIGLWRIVVVKSLPYTDMRRVGKIPKLLPHRLFPSARYSIWLDSKLRLQLDPLLILEYFLWRKGYEFAISNHYDRHCVWEEVAQNKKLNKYNHTVIDEQFAFYQADGLTRFDALDPNKILPSNVPEGSLIVRAHTPMSNLFSCLWFNEVERFTPRDQLSFAYTYQKLKRMNPSTPFYLNMFKDCERRKIAKLYRHRSEEKRNVGQRAIE
ncbi:DUF616 domain-containing protein [Cephalotus follicularis]|uniref:DUF616 domain-containing protein n=1 Tax=Cephalotus follicularis TaxID=3775 RepID=A0A1Q3AUU4_CEPFO|nr:DUF616 domain-containing protein [Cephalotus follicularis]